MNEWSLISHVVRPAGTKTCYKTIGFERENKYQGGVWWVNKFAILLPPLFMNTIKKVGPFPAEIDPATIMTEQIFTFLGVKRMYAGLQNMHLHKALNLQTFFSKKKYTRQESSMIHSASPQSRPAVIVA